MERALGFLRSQTEVNTMLQAVKDQTSSLERIPEATRNGNTDFIELALVISVDNVLGTREIDYLLKPGRNLVLVESLYEW